MAKFEEHDFEGRLGVLKKGDDIVYNPYVCASNEFNGTIKHFLSRKGSTFGGKPYIWVVLENGDKIGFTSIIRKGSDG